ncbi:MAG: glycosyltransferase [Proteobacteria bacterium]|nr:glycosyltransferase [Pseudomonadota bacterium]
MRILQVSTYDIAGGAEAVGLQLFQAYRDLGHDSWLAVGLKRRNDPDVLMIPNCAYRNRWARIWNTGGNLLSSFVGRQRNVGRLNRLFQIGIGQPQRWLDIWQGKEDLDFPGTWRLLDFTPERPDILHCHNMHGAWLPTGGYFDLRALSWLTRQLPVVLTLHDAWLLSGHCAHSFDCERWKIGCGHCPDLTIYPAIRRDATAYNWQRKRGIYAKSRVYVATPSQWLMRKVEQSILASAIVEARVIHNGVDLTTFHPGDWRESRAMLGIAQDARVLLFVGNKTRSNPWRDYAALEEAVKRVSERLPHERVIFVCLGEKQKTGSIGRERMRFIGYQKDPVTIARFYQAADVYLHAAKADTFPNTVLEALACGTPVVATAVGGIPEQIEEGETGFLVLPGDSSGMAERIQQLLQDENMRNRMGTQAADFARKHFGPERMVGDYLGWYQEILEECRMSCSK